MGIKNKKQIAAILETARVELEKLHDLSVDEDTAYDEASESKQERMDNDPDSSFLRESAGEMEDAESLLQSLIDSLGE